MYQENIKEIEELINNYFEGIFNGDVTKLTNCFHKDANIYGDIKGVNYSKRIHKYLEGVLFPIIKLTSIQRKSHTVIFRHF